MALDGFISLLNHTLPNLQSIGYRELGEKHIEFRAESEE
jgi:hypothetical protein